MKKAAATRAQLARDVLMMAAFGGMPDSYWLTDSRVKRACRVLGWKAGDAREWAQDEASRKGRR